MTDKTDRDALVALDIAIAHAAQSRVSLHLTRAKQIREAASA
ncbi:MAG TPA: hypothetical protein VFH85_07895 [Gammaproteobacteria bacterium]|nr:hypothetical protein [Gammaproteobacteria bacterium]